ncbi:MAG TPA: S8 family serine peptidase, partial [Vicinamibacterales bacterium]|nr:S8 family serine peptidase [Vicinamibacterales bacterium]
MRRSLAYVVLAILCSAGIHSPVRLQGQASGASLTPWLDTALRQGTADQRHAVWVYYRDKGARVTAQSTSLPVSARALGRRARRARAAAWNAYDDRAVASAYVEQVAVRVTRVRHTLRWLNATSVEATAAQVRALAALPFVDRLDVVHRYRAEREPQEAVRPAAAPDGHRLRGLSTHALDYGTSFEQLSQIRVPELHERGLSGDGVLVALFDTGFPNLEHEAFSAMKIVSQWDFIRGIDDVRGGGDGHGTATLSVAGGFRPGELIGPAFGASFVLAVTEDIRSETPIEEDNWAAAAEWAESWGADVISSSLGYAQFDLPHASYTDRDMDGMTAVATRAATMAAARGVVVVNSAGNGGFHPTRNTLVAPADGLYVVSAGAVDRTGARADFSSVGPTADGRTKPDVAALGVAVKSATVVTTDSYAAFSGTSLSCPLIAGVVALLLQAHPAYSVDDVLLALRATSSQSAVPDNLLGWGVLDAVAAVDLELGSVAAPVED